MSAVLTLKNWCVVYRGDEYTPPELCHPHLMGEVGDHPRLGSGEITTSAVVKTTKHDGEFHFHTYSGSVYRLEGPCNPKWEAMFPDAANRFFAAVEKTIEEAPDGN